jgi:hypothetical protein
MIDSGANCSAVHDVSRLYKVNSNSDVVISGSAGNITVKVTGLSRVLDLPAVLIKHMTFDIVAWSQLEETHYVQSFQQRGVVLAVHKSDKSYFFFTKQQGMYFADYLYANSSDPFIELERLFPVTEEYVNKHHQCDNQGVKMFPIEQLDDSEIEEQFVENSLRRENVSERIIAEVLKIRQMHLALGHPMQAAMNNVLNIINNQVLRNKKNGRERKGLNSLLSPEAIKKYHQVFGKCTTCGRAKMTKDENHFRSSIPVKGVGDAVHVDLMFYRKKLKRCFFVAIDEFSGYTMVVHLANKSAESVRLAVKFVKDYYHQYRHRLKSVRSDRDKAITDRSLGAL